VRDNGVTFSGSTQAGRGPSAYTVVSTMDTEAHRGIIIGVFGGENAALNISHSGIQCCGGLSSLSSVATTLGDGEGASGTLNMNVGAFNVTGASSSEYNLIVGNRGTGSINVNGGTDLNVSAGKTSLGNYDTGVGTVSVSGAGSTWFQGFTLDVGREGRGAITIQNGASFNGGITSLGAQPSGTGTVTVTGNGSTWNNNSGGFLVGVSGHGFLNIEDGGVTNGHTGTLALAPSGFAAAVVTGSGSRWNNSGSVWVGGSETGPGGDATLNVSDGAVVAVGVGRDLIIWRSGRLDGNGTIEGHVRNEGIVAPGNSSGVLTVTGNYSQRNDARYLVEIFGLNQGTEYDLLDVGGIANLAGTLDVDFGHDDYTPALGDTFEILKATGGVVGSFDNESLPAIGQNVRLTTI
jgi:T5SS/PEP-CTERM-associated repeat protein